RCATAPGRGSSRGRVGVVAPARPHTRHTETEVRRWFRRPSGLVLPRHRGTTANLSSLYPWHTGPGPSRRGPYLGVNVTGGGTGWFYDPFELYGGALTDSNVLIAGRPGKGKSSAVKTFL